MKRSPLLSAIFTGVLVTGLVIAGCSSSSAGSSNGASGVPSYVTCTKNRATSTCTCMVGPQTLSADVTEVESCDDAPSGAIVCAVLSTGQIAESCYYQVAQCGKVNRNFNSCECAYNNSGLSASPVTACSDPLCCQFGDSCTCTTLTGESIKNTQYDRSCTYFGPGTVVSSCTPALQGKCPGAFTTVSSCKGLTWKEPG